MNTALQVLATSALTFDRKLAGLRQLPGVYRNKSGKGIQLLWLGLPCIIGKGNTALVLPIAYLHEGTDVVKSVNPDIMLARDQAGSEYIVIRLAAPYPENSAIAINAQKALFFVRAESQILTKKKYAQSKSQAPTVSKKTTAERAAVVETSEPVVKKGFARRTVEWTAEKYVQWLEKKQQKRLVNQSAKAKPKPPAKPKAPTESKATGQDMSVVDAGAIGGVMKDLLINMGDTSSFQIKASTETAVLGESKSKGYKLIVNKFGSGPVIVSILVTTDSQPGMPQKDMEEIINGCGFQIADLQTGKEFGEMKMLQPVGKQDKGFFGKTPIVKTLSAKFELPKECANSDLSIKVILSDSATTQVSGQQSTPTGVKQVHEIRPGSGLVDIDESVILVLKQSAGAGDDKEVVVHDVEPEDVVDLVAKLQRNVEPEDSTIVAASTEEAIELDGEGSSPLDIFGQVGKLIPGAEEGDDIDEGLPGRPPKVHEISDDDVLTFDEALGQYSSSKGKTSGAGAVGEEKSVAEAAIEIDAKNVSELRVETANGIEAFPWDSRLLEGRHVGEIAETIQGLLGCASVDDVILFEYDQRANIVTVRKADDLKIEIELYINEEDVSPEQWDRIRLIWGNFDDKEHERFRKGVIGDYLVFQEWDGEEIYIYGLRETDSTEAPLRRFTLSELREEAKTRTALVMDDQDARRETIIEFLKYDIGLQDENIQPAKTLSEAVEICERYGKADITIDNLIEPDYDTVQRTLMIDGTYGITAISRLSDDDDKQRAKYAVIAMLATQM